MCSDCKITELEQKISTRDLELASLMESHRVELEVYAHKVKHLQHETKVDVTKVRNTTEAVLTQNHQSFREKVEKGEKEKVVVEQDLEDQMISAHGKISHLLSGNKMDLEELRAKQAAAIETYRATVAERMRELEEKLDVQRRVELQEIEDRKNSHLRTLMSNHEQAFAEMREYYRAITADNLGLIKRYEEELKELATNETRNMELLRSARQQNDDVSPSEKACSSSAMIVIISLLLDDL